MSILRVWLVVALSLVSFQVKALTINGSIYVDNTGQYDGYNGIGTYSNLDCDIVADCWNGPDNSPANPSTATLEAYITGLTGNLTEEYKSDVTNAGGSDESGAFNSVYNTSYSNSPTDPEDALIDYLGGTGMDCVAAGCFLLVKDGNSAPSWYLFDLSAYSSFAWDGESDIVIEDFWPNQGAISHVSLYSGQVNIPEPSSLILLGLGLIGLGLRKRAS